MGPALGCEAETQCPEHGEAARNAPWLPPDVQGSCHATIDSNIFCHASNLNARVGHRLSNRKNNFFFSQTPLPARDAGLWCRVPDAEKFHHNVYVILLNPAVLKHPSILRLNPKRDPTKPCVYVGMTGLPVEHRFENHKHGYKSSWVVEKYGVRLLPELFAHLNPMPFEAAAQMEMELAEDLRAEGYTVTGGK